MLDDQDLKKIGTEFGNFYEQTIAPQFDELREEIGGIKGEIKEIRSTMATKKDIMDTRDYLADKIADLSGETVVRDKKLEEKIDTQTSIMASHGLIDQADLERLGQIKIFPKPAE
ncbi:MAG: hypothetical protein PHW53_01630 [Patescibacteria group bacterium]|nr:hypothetical protein [Patescibacteria group bacterium]